MSVKTDASGRRSVQVEVELPGTPEDVWQAIATGPGISSWFVPTEFEDGDGRPVAVKANFGPGMTSRSLVTAWHPPRTFAVQGEGWGGSPPIATEWSIEARAGGVCLVRVVHSLFASTDDWDDQLEATESGWPGFFRTLRIYLTHYRGQRSTLLQYVAPFAGSETEAWTALTTSMRLDGLRVGQQWSAPATAPTLGGVAEHVSESPYDILLRLDEPGPGVAAFGAFDMGGRSMVAVSFYHYGDRSIETAAREKAPWQAWIDERFPMSDEPKRTTVASAQSAPAVE